MRMNNMNISGNSCAFTEFDFDGRLLKAITEIGWERPTPVQAATIPLALAGKNVLARARTGSGKTAAFLLPLIQKVLQLTKGRSTSKTIDGDNSGPPYALIIAPTKELASQIFDQIDKLIAPFPFIQCLNLAHFLDSNDQLAVQEIHDEILVATPGRLLAACAKMPASFLGSLHFLVLDEADLLFSYGYKAEMERLKPLLPQRFQTIMTSATLNEDLSELKRMFVVGKVATLRLKEGDLPGIDQLEQFHISCHNDEERFSILLALVKLKLLIGKSVVFVSTVERCYKLHLFLQTFKIASCVLNAQMPANSRCRVIHEFNQGGRWPFLIASECNDIFDEANEEEEGEASNSNANEADGEQQKQGKTKKQKRREMRKANGSKRRRHLDKESGIGRGIDFHSVSNVINFDFPLSADMYVHRVGRTARGFNKGTAISFASTEEKTLFEQIQREVNDRMGHPVIRPYEVNMKDFEAFQLRARDVLAACTRTVIRETRMAEIREELLHSRRLDSYFAKNPRERWAFEQDRKQFKLNVHSAGIADVPDYMVPKALRGQDFTTGSNTLPNGNAGRNKRRKRMGQQPTQEDGDEEDNDNDYGDYEGDGEKGGGQQQHKRMKHKFMKGKAKRKFQQRMADPLQSFKF